MEILSQEQQFFLNSLQDYLNERVTIIPVSLDWNVLKAYADHHQVSAIFYKQTRSLMFQSAYSQQLYRFINYTKLIESFKEILSGYSFFFVKGVGIANLYPIPALRSMGDVDVVIHIEDREDIHEALLTAGFNCFDSLDGEWKYEKNGYVFEIHDALVHRRVELEGLESYFSDVWNYVTGDHLDWSYHLVYLIEHLRHHFVMQGAGFRQFMDVAVVCQRCAIDWKFVETELQKIGLYDFAVTVFAFNKAWFDVSVPIILTELSEEFYVAATQKIFEDGVFGFNNAENDSSAIAMRIQYQGISQKNAKQIYMVKQFFPDYEAMCRLPYCSYVRNCRVLLPFAWIHRIIYRLFSSESREYMKKQMDDDKVSARINMLKQWGLKVNN